MANDSELLPGELDEVLGGLEADLRDPGRIEREPLERRLSEIEAELRDLNHRLNHASESYEKPHIQPQITQLEMEKARIINQISELGDK